MQLAALTEGARRERRRAEQAALGPKQRVHGLELVPLPSDFLCARCACEFRRLDVAAAREGVAGGWCKRMGLCHSDDSAAKAGLVAEQERLRLRDELLRSAEGGDPEAFRSLLLDKRLSKQSVSSRWSAALSPNMFHVQASHGGWRTHPRCFGFRQRRDGVFFSEALATCQEPVRWEHYTGRACFVESQKVFVQRAGPWPAEALRR
jgi:hypothetical protein